MSVSIAALLTTVLTGAWMTKRGTDLVGAVQDAAGRKLSQLERRIVAEVQRDTDAYVDSRGRPIGSSLTALVAHFAETSDGLGVVGSFAAGLVGQRQHDALACCRAQGHKLGERRTHRPKNEPPYTSRTCERCSFQEIDD